MMTMKQWRAKCTEQFNAEPSSFASKSKKDRLCSKPLVSKKPSKNTLSNELESLGDVL